MRRGSKNTKNLEFKLKQARFKNESIGKVNIHVCSINVIKKWQVVRISEEQLGSHFSEIKDSMSQLKTILGDF